MRAFPTGRNELIKKAKPPRIKLISLGCPKALVDSEQILNRLRAEGYLLVADDEKADLCIINTCGFIDAATEESLDTIGEALQGKEKVIVTGCLGQKQSLITEKYPQILAITGPHCPDEVLQHVHTHFPPAHEPFLDLLPAQGIKLTPAHYAYLKISEGCNHDCSFCIIPSLRGSLESRPIGDILKEAEILAESGVKELLVISQDTSAYGIDKKYQTAFHGGRPLKTRLTELCSELGKLGIWIRLHYVYPYPSVDALIPLMAEGKILPYLDVPFQHANSRILQAMKRPASVENNLERLRKWRSICPEITVRSTFITGFPGETEAEFEELLEFLEEAKLDRVGCFAYSPVEGAAANALPGALPEEVREDRKRRLMEVQEDISADKLAAKIDATITVLVDEIDDEGTIARSASDAPDIDGLVFIDNFFDAEPGDFLEVKVIDSDEHDLYASLVDKQ